MREEEEEGGRVMKEEKGRRRNEGGGGGMKGKEMRERGGITLVSFFWHHVRFVESRRYKLNISANKYKLTISLCYE